MSDQAEPIGADPFDDCLGVHVQANASRLAATRTPDPKAAGVEREAVERRHIMPGDPHNIQQIALQWYLGFEFGHPHSTRESNIGVEAFKDGYRAALRAVDAAPGGGVPVPDGVFYLSEHDNFYDSSTLKGMGQPFWLEWKDRSGEFPSAPATPTAAPAPNVQALVEAASDVSAHKFSTYKARNGREVGVQGDDGEKCWIIHSDYIFALEGALAAIQAPAGEGVA